MVSIFYGSTFLHRSQLLCIINRALHPFARATHPLSLSLPSCSPLLLFSLAAAANLTNRIILRRGLNGFRSILNTPSPLLEYVVSFSLPFSPSFLFFFEYRESPLYRQLNSRYCKCTKHREAVGNSFCVHDRDNGLKVL